eukprot:CAMPEP_0185192682 /NCGR_PEP_ID=MMETSP1140-20130426/19868_1 /TAXON_ID=298111 /ORGANISM="Pavlova sp., Strain CCMP459" /LENGTH=181 /DNA_ID=CAMNT_0027759441 /DNA_START=351 /DNA_END=892 /DNA_ORIENTATION=-
MSHLRDEVRVHLERPDEFVDRQRACVMTACVPPECWPGKVEAVVLVHGHPALVHLHEDREEDVLKDRKLVGGGPMGRQVVFHQGQTRLAFARVVVTEGTWPAVGVMGSDAARVASSLLKDQGDTCASKAAAGAETTTTPCRALALAGGGDQPHTAAVHHPLLTSRPDNRTKRNRATLGCPP